MSSPLELMEQIEKSAAKGDKSRHLWEELKMKVAQIDVLSPYSQTVEDDIRDRLYTVEDGWVELHSGVAFEYRAPVKEMFRIMDVAHSLGKMCRFAGHTHTFYSVAEHSCLMMRHLRSAGETDRRLLRTVLMHDLAETYLVDLPRPLKVMMPQYLVLEKRIEAAAAESFDLIYPFPPVVRMLDSRILVDERAQAMNLSDNDWGVDVLEPLGVKLHFWPPAEAIDNFIGDFLELSRK